MKFQSGNLLVIATDADFRETDGKVEIFDSNSGRLICSLIVQNLPKRGADGGIYPFIHFELIQPDQSDIQKSTETEKTNSNAEQPIVEPPQRKKRDCSFDKWLDSGAYVRRNGTLMEALNEFECDSFFVRMVKDYQDQQDRIAAGKDGEPAELPQSPEKTAKDIIDLIEARDPEALKPLVVRIE